MEKQSTIKISSTAEQYLGRFCILPIFELVCGTPLLLWEGFLDVPAVRDLLLFEPPPKPFVDDTFPFPIKNDARTPVPLLDFIPLISNPDVTVSLFSSVDDFEVRCTIYVTISDAELFPSVRIKNYVIKAIINTITIEVRQTDAWRAVNLSISSLIYNQTTRDTHNRYPAVLENRDIFPILFSQDGNTGAVQTSVHRQSSFCSSSDQISRRILPDPPQTIATAMLFGQSNKLLSQLFSDPRTLHETCGLRERRFFARSAGVRRNTTDIQ